MKQEEKMNTNQRVGFVYRVVEDQQKEKPLSPLDLKNLTHYANTGEWLDEEIKEFEKYMEDKETLSELHHYAERARELMGTATAHLQYDKFWKTVEEELKDLAEYKALVDKINKEHEEARMRYICESREIAKHEECVTLYKDLHTALHNMDNIDNRKSTCFETPDGDIYKCVIERRGKRLVIRPTQKLKL